MATKTCAGCGAAAGKTAKFCKACGHPLDSDPAEKMTPTTVEKTEGEKKDDPTPPDLFTDDVLDELEAGDSVAESPSTEAHEVTAAEDPAEVAADTIKTPELRLQVIDGERAGEVFALPLDASLVIGTAPESDVALTDACVSRQHAIVTRTASGVEVKDQGSTNGTYVAVEGLRQLHEGEVLRVGRTHLRVVGEK